MQRYVSPGPFGSAFPALKFSDSNTHNLCGGELLWFLSGCGLICVDFPVNWLLSCLALYFQPAFTIYVQTLIRTPVGELA